MTNPILNNYIGNEEVILWQYDKAVNLINLINRWNQWAKASCEDFWNYFGNWIFPIDQADTYGLNVWGNLLGIPRPTIKIPRGSDSNEGGVDYVTVPTGDDSSTSNSDESSDSEEDRFDQYGYDKDGYRVSAVNEDEDWKIVTIKNSLYRGLLKGRFFMMGHPPTVPNYNRFLSLVFGCFKRPDEDDSSSDASDYSDSSDSSEGSIDHRVHRYVYDADGNVRTGEGFVTRNKALDFQNMTMGFTFPDEATIEEAYLIFQHYDILYPFPAGIRYPGEFLYDDLVIGLNEDQTKGQNYKNFVDGLVLAEDPNPINKNGGIFAATDRANYKVPAKATGWAYVYRIPAGKKIQISVTPASDIANKTRIPVWIDWGNGDAGYRYIIKGTDSSCDIESEEYPVEGIYALVVVYKNSDIGNIQISMPGETPEEIGSHKIWLA